MGAGWTPAEGGAVGSGACAGGGAVVGRLGGGPRRRLYSGGARWGAEPGMRVPGPHTPPSHNGFKMVLSGKPFFAEAIQELGRVALELGITSGPRGKVEEQA